MSLSIKPVSAYQSYVGVRNIQNNSGNKRADSPIQDKIGYGSSKENQNQHQDQALGLNALIKYIFFNKAKNKNFETAGTLAKNNETGLGSVKNKVNRVLDIIG